MATLVSASPANGMHTLRARDAEAVTFFCLNDVFKPRKLKPSQFPAVIGRQVADAEDTSSLLFASKVVSRQHAVMQCTNGKYFVRDTRSAGGTFVNYRRLSAPKEESPWTEVKDGDVVSLGVDIDQPGNYIQCVRFFVQMPKSHRSSRIMTEDELRDTTYVFKDDKTASFAKLRTGASGRLQPPKPLQVSNTAAAGVGELESSFGSMRLQQEQNTGVVLYSRDGDIKLVPCTTKTTVTKILAAIHQPSSKLYIIRNRLYERELRPNECPGAMQLHALIEAGFSLELGLLNEAKKDITYLVQFICSDQAEKTQIRSQSLDITSVIDFSWRNIMSLEALTQRINSQQFVSRIDLSGNPSLSLILPPSFPENVQSSLTELVLTDLSLTSVPESVGQLGALAVLDLSRNAITTIPSSVFEALGEFAQEFEASSSGPDQNVPGLRTLRLSGNKITNLPSTLAHIANTLDNLALDNNDLVALPPVLAELTYLAHLDVSHNNIASFPANIFALPSLGNFLFAGNQVASLPTEFFSNKTLSFVDARRNKLKQFSDCSGMIMLHTLLLDDNLFESVEATGTSLQTVSLNNNSKLKDLVFSGARLPSGGGGTPSNAKQSSAVTSPDSPSTSRVASRSMTPTAYSLPPPIVPKGGLTITTLNLTKCSLSSLPNVLPRVLQHLLVSRNALIALPPSLSACANLTTLNVSHNKLQSLPSGIEGLTSLAHLNVSDNDLVSLPSGLWFLPLVTLFASTNKIAELAPPPFNPRTSSLAKNLQVLALGSNRLSSDRNVFATISHLGYLKLLDLSYNGLAEVPSSIVGLTGLTELYLSGNALSSIPEEIDQIRHLQVLTVAENQFTMLPGSISKLKALRFIDASYNRLSFESVSWPQCWIWVWNTGLLHLDLTGNDKLVIATSQRDQVDFSKLERIKILDLKDVQLQVPIPAELKRRGRFRRTRQALQIPYGISESLGHDNNIVLWSHAISRIPKESEAHLFSIIDSTEGALSRLVHEKFPIQFALEHKAAKSVPTSPQERQVLAHAFARTFLVLNTEVAQAGPPMSNAICSAVFCYINGRTLTVANAGTAQALLVKTNGDTDFLTHHHTCAEPAEAARIHQLGGFLERDGSLARPKGVEPQFYTSTLASHALHSASSSYVESGASADEDNDVPSDSNLSLVTSRGIGLSHMLPLVNALPYVKHIDFADADDYVVMANLAFWNVMTKETVSAAIKSYFGLDCYRIAQRLRDKAISHGARDAIMVQVVDVRANSFVDRRHTPSGSSSNLSPSKRTFSTDVNEIKPPTEVVVFVFTDVKQSTALWEKSAPAMKEAIDMHNYIMREYLLETKGYEVKTEGDAFMVVFWSVNDAIDWAITIQKRLLNAAWPQPLLREPHASEKRNDKGELLFRGLTVRMGIHMGFPVCEVDPTTGRMDYFGPVVNRAARICSAADGGEIYISADSWAEITSNDKEKAELAKRGVDITAIDIGDFNLKGLDSPEHLFLLFPKQLDGRRQFMRSQQPKAQEASPPIPHIK